MTQRLPTPGSDNNTWGDVLNGFLEVSHNSDGSLASNTVGTSQIQNNAVTNAQLDSSTQSAITKANGSLQASNNLSDLSTASVARTNLGLGSAATMTAGGASGVATLNSSSTLTSSQLPASVSNVSSTFPFFNVNNYGADPTGTNDSTSAFEAAYTAANATLSTSQPGAFVTFGAGTYKVTCGNLTATDPRIGIMGPGSEICIINAFGSGDLFYHSSGNFNTIHEGLKFSGFTMDGTNTTGAATGLHVADMGQVHYDDLLAQNFSQSGSFGFNFTTVTGWSEKLLYTRIVSTNNNTGMAFTGSGSLVNGSFDYMRCFDVAMTILPGQTGVNISNYAQLDQVHLELSFNCHLVASGASQTALSVGNSSGDQARIINALLDVRGETDGSGSTALDFNVGSSAKINGVGVWCFVSNFTAGNANSNGGFVYLAGVVSGPSMVAKNKIFGAGNFSAYAGEFPVPTQAKGVTLLDLASSSGSTRSSIYGVTGNPNGNNNYFASPGDIAIRQDVPSTASAQLYVNRGSGSNTVWGPVVAASIASATVTLTAGSSGSIANASITSSSIIRVFNISAAGTVGALSVALAAGTGFTINSTSGADTSKVFYEIVQF